VLPAMTSDETFEDEGRAPDWHEPGERDHRRVRSRQAEPLNEVVREHELTVAAAEWGFRPHAELLHEWFDLFNDRLFQGWIPRCFLRFERLRSSRIGQYCRTRNSVGAAHEITINTLYLDLPEFELLACLLHEMAHEWQELFGKPGHGNYHNEEFVRKCQRLGISVERGRGHHVGYGESFVGLLEEYGVPFEPVFAQGEVLPKTGNLGSSKLKKWTCGCTNIRAAVEVAAACLRCGHPFRREQ
jgi:hypothetical protein